MIKIPDKCRFIFDKLEYNGFECYAVGGCVRDSLMGLTPKDWDFTTNAKPDEICSVFSEYKLVTVGKKFGTISVVSDGETYEITTFRGDGNYSDSRHPDSVAFCDSVIDDLCRRDFTMNSIAFSKTTGIVDPFGGCEDIKKGLIRCTGEPSKRFSEDAIRIFRAVRFASVLNFKIEEHTKDAVFACKDNLKSVHPTRLNKELTALLTGTGCCKVLSEYADVLAVIIPEIKPMFNCSQNNPHHKYDVWNHTIKALEYSPDDITVLLTLLFHDSGKPFVKTTDDKLIDHFKKHQIKSAEIAESVLSRFSYPSALINDVCLLIKYHDERFKKMNESIKFTLNVLGERLFDLLMTVSYCDKSAQSEYKRKEKSEYMFRVKKEAEHIIKTNQCYSLSQLNVNGNDILNLGYSGKEVGNILNELLCQVIKGKIDNVKTELLDAACRVSV